MPTKRKPAIPTESRLLDQRWERAGDELRRLDPDEFRRLLELGEAIVQWFRARPDGEPRDFDAAPLHPTPRADELN